MGKFDGRVAIITGGGKGGGIGYGLSTAFAKEGCNLVITGRNTKKLDDAKEELEELDCDTVGGLVFALLPVIPEDGSRPVVEAMGLRIRVEELWERRVEWALAEKAAPASEEND